MLWKFASRAWKATGLNSLTRGTADFNDDSILELTPDLVGATETQNSGIIGAPVNLTLAHTGDVRPSQVLYELTTHLLMSKWRDLGEDPKLHLLLDPEIMGSLAAIGIVKGKPFNPDARMKKILTDAAAIGTAAARTLDWRPRPAEGFFYYPNSAWTEPLFVGGYNFETPPPEVNATGTITVNPPTGARTLNARTSFSSTQPTSPQQ